MKKKFVGTLGGLALACLAVGLAARPASAESTETKNFGLHFGGYYLMTQNGTSTQESVKGLGILTSDSSGNLTGNETFTMVNPALPSSSSSQSVCTGTVSGSISPSSSGIFTITLNYTPDSSLPAACVATNTTLQCTRRISQRSEESEVAVGHYSCIATLVSTSASSTSIDAASESAHLSAYVLNPGIVRKNQDR